MSILLVLAAASIASSLELEFNTTESIDPHKGDKLPAYAKTFPGCGCTWNEQRGKWSCEGSIAFPEEVQGLKCGCCGLNCVKSNRKSDEECLIGGFDQAAEMEAERKRLSELLKGADLLLGDDLPGFIVTVPDKGRCTNNLLEKACKLGKGNDTDLTPICDHTSYVATNKCFTPGVNSGSKFWHKHFSHWTSHRAKMNLDIDDEIFYGMCFFTSSGGNTLYPTNAGHAWSQGNAPVTPRSGLFKPSKPVPMAQMNSGDGELGSWRTICVKQAPNKNQVQR